MRLCLSLLSLSLSLRHTLTTSRNITTGQSWTQNGRTTWSAEGVGVATLTAACSSSSSCSSVHQAFDQRRAIHRRDFWQRFQSTERSLTRGTGESARANGFFRGSSRGLKIRFGYRGSEALAQETRRDRDRVQSVSCKNSEEVKSQRTDFRRSTLKRSWRAREPVERPFALLWWTCTVYNRHHHTTAHTGRMASNRSILGKSMINVPGKRARNLTNSEIRNEN